MDDEIRVGSAFNQKDYTIHNLKGTQERREQIEEELSYRENDITKCSENRSEFWDRIKEKEKEAIRIKEKEKEANRIKEKEIAANRIKEKEMEANRIKEEEQEGKRIKEEENEANRIKEKKKEAIKENN